MSNKTDIESLEREIAELKKDLILVDTLYRQSCSSINDLREALEESRRELQACQAVIHLDGGFDPAYVNGAKASIKKTDAVLAKTQAQSLQAFENEVIERCAEIAKKYDGMSGDSISKIIRALKGN